VAVVGEHLAVGLLAREEQVAAAMVVQPQMELPQLSILAAVAAVQADNHPRLLAKLAVTAAPVS
jgi:hypothetical protein